MLIFLSTFNDGRQALMFGVNPLGIQKDGALAEGISQARTPGSFSGISSGREAPDLSPDYVYESKGRVTDTGYQVEIRIPFKSLQYQPGARQNWGLHIIRGVQRNGYEYSWALARRAGASFLTQGGTLDGLEGLRRGLVLDLTPIVTASVEGAPVADGRWAYDVAKPEFGANLRWGVTPNLTLNGTINPDFSQVEADQAQFLYDPRSSNPTVSTNSFTAAISFAGTFTTIWGHAEDFYEWSPAHILMMDVSGDWRPIPQIRVNSTYSLQDDVRRSDGSRVGRRQIPRVKIEYQLSRSIFLRRLK